MIGFIVASQWADNSVRLVNFVHSQSIFVIMVRTDQKSEFEHFITINVNKTAKYDKRICFNKNISTHIKRDQ